MTLGGGCARALLQGAVLQGADPLDVLRRAGVSPAVYGDPEQRIDGCDYGRIIDVIRADMDDFFIGFLEQPAKLALDREQARARLACRTLGEAMRTSTQFREAVRNDISYGYRKDADGRVFALEVEYQTQPGVDRDFFHWHRLLEIYRYYSWLIGRRLTLSRVCVQAPAPSAFDDRQRYDLFDCEVRFGQPRHAISFEDRFLLAPVVRKSEVEHLEYLAAGSDWFAAPGEGSSWARRAEQAVVQMQKEGEFSPATSTVSAMLGVSVRSLRRYLARENTSFSDIRDRARFELAAAYLTATDLPISCIAEEVGYGEPGNFTRAFLGWAGCNPSTFREQHANDKSRISERISRLRLHHGAPN